MIILTDIHGNYDTLMALLAMIPEEEKAKGIVVCGDLIDRGPKSRQVVQWAIDNKIPCVKGNHEQMMVDWIANGCRYGDMLWLGNGGDKALDSYKEKPKVDFDDDDYVPGQYLKGEINMEVFKKHALWMDSLPFYIEFPDIKNDEGRYLVISHSNIGNVWNVKDTERGQAEITWGRPHKIKDVPEIYNVIGHTPQENGARLRKIYANIDTGCFYTRGGYGKLTALQFPEMIIYEHENIDKEKKDNPVKNILTAEELENRKKHEQRWNPSKKRY